MSAFVRSMVRLAEPSMNGGREGAMTVGMIRRNRKNTTRASRTFLLLALAIVAALAPMASAEAESNHPAFSYGGTTDLPILFFLVPKDNLRPFMPDEWWQRLSDDFGDQVPIAVYSSLGDIWVKSGGTTRTIYSGVFTFLRSGTVGDKRCDPIQNIYDIWLTTDNSELYAHHKSVGFRTGLVPDSMVEITRVGAADVFEANVPWDQSPFSFTAVSTEPVTPDDDSPNCGWHVGSRGVVREAFSYPHFQAGGGQGVLRLDPASPLGRLIGAKTDSVVADLVVFERLNFSGEISLVG